MIKEETASPIYVNPASPTELVHKTESIDGDVVANMYHHHPGTFASQTIPSASFDFLGPGPNYTWIPQEPQEVNMVYQAPFPPQPSASQPMFDSFLQGLDLSFPFTDMTAAMAQFGNMQQPGPCPYPPFGVPISQSDADRMALYSCMAQAQATADSSLYYDGTWTHPPMPHPGDPQAFFTCPPNTPTFPAYLAPGPLSPSQMAPLYTGQPPQGFPGPYAPSFLLEGQGHDQSAQ